MTARFGCFSNGLNPKDNCTSFDTLRSLTMYEISTQYREPASTPGSAHAPIPAVRAAMKPVLRLVAAATLLSAISANAGIADESNFCSQLSIVVAEQPSSFRRLRSDRFDNMLESFETDLMLPGFETCRIDAITPGYFCMVRGLTAQAGDELAGELVQRVHSCYPHVRAEQGVDPGSPVQRTVTDWTFDNGARIRIVRRVYRDHLGSVFIYVR
jgi:hypothetical protein